MSDISVKAATAGRAALDAHAPGRQDGLSLKDIIIWASAAGLLGLGLGLHLRFPAKAFDGWPIWFALSLGLLTLWPILRRKPGYAATRLNLARAAWACLAGAFLLDAAVLAVEYSTMRHLFFTVSRASLWSNSLVTLFMALQLSRETVSRKEAIVSCGALFLHILVLLCQPDFFGAVLLCAVWCALACIGGLNRFLKRCFMIGGFGAVCFFPLLFTASFYNYLKIKFTKGWLDPFSAPLSEGYHLVQYAEAIKKAGAWGLGQHSLVSSVSEALPGKLASGGPVFLSVWLGNVTMGIAMCALVCLFFFLLSVVRAVKSLPLRNSLLGLWILYAMAQIVSVLSPFGLLPLVGSYGVLFLGSPQAGLAFLLLCYGAFIAEKSGS